MSSTFTSQSRGVIPPVVTALTPDGTVDRASQLAVCGRQLDAGAHGLFVAGTTGEGAFLTPSLLADVVEIAVEAAGGAVPVLAGALAPGTPGVVAAARVAERGGADGIVVTTPFYAALAPAELVAHFRTVAAAVDLPVVAYSIPPMTHQPMPTAVVERLFTEDLVVGLKDSGHDWDLLAAAIDLGTQHGKSVFSGYEPFAGHAVARGASGIVASLCNIDPWTVVHLWEGATTGQDVTADQQRLAGLADALARCEGEHTGATSALVGGIKALLESWGVIASRTALPPLSTMSENSTGTLRSEVESLTGLDR